MSKASILREKCCNVVMRGGQIQPEYVIDALDELEADYKAQAARIEGLEAALREIATGPDHNVDAQIARTALAKLEKEEGK